MFKTVKAVASRPNARRWLSATAGLALAATASISAAQAADTIKVGVVAPFSGPFAIYGKQYKEAIAVYVDQHGTKAGDHDIEFIYKDVGGPNPDNSRSLAQELLIREQVDYRFCLAVNIAHH